MNQEKIGKFIQESRKKKKLTQSELAEKLGVSDRTVGNWENGRNMPDLSLFKPLCDELDITINELISGEKLKKEVYQEKLEENIINTINYSTKKIKINNNILGTILICIGLMMAITAMTVFESESSWGSIYSILGGIISLVGVSKLTKNLSYPKRLLIHFGYFVSFIMILFIVDYLSVLNLDQLSRFCLVKRTSDNIYMCENPFYNVYKVNRNTINEYFIVDMDKEYTMDTVPNIPFNRTKSNIGNIIKYKNKYVGNNSNTSNLINSLPLSEYGYTLEIDSKNLGVTINYHMTDWYINENYYLQKSIVYNSVSMFILIDNLECIKFNFSGKTYEVKRENVENNIPYYNAIVENEINQDLFNKYVEDKVNDIEFVEDIFNKIVF